MPIKEHSPLKSLVLFIVCLAIAASVLAGFHYYAVDLPQQKALQAPENSDIDCQLCLATCHNLWQLQGWYAYHDCIRSCDPVCPT